MPCSIYLLVRMLPCVTPEDCEILKSMGRCLNVQLASLKSHLVHRYVEMLHSNGKLSL